MLQDNANHPTIIFYPLLIAYLSSVISTYLHR